MRGDDNQRTRRAVEKHRALVGARRFRANVIVLICVFVCLAVVIHLGEDGHGGDQAEDRSVGSRGTPGGHSGRHCDISRNI